MLGLPGDRRLPAVARARDGLPARRPRSTSSRGRGVHRPGRRRRSTTCRCPRARCSTSTSRRARSTASRSRGSASASTATSSRCVEEDVRAASCTASTATRPSYHDEAGTDLAAVAAGPDRRHAAALRPHRRARDGGAAGLRPRAAARAGRARGGVSDGASARPSCASSSRYHGHRYYVLDDPEIGDDAYDALLDELRAIEAEHPELRHARLADPARRRRAGLPAGEGHATCSRCSRWPTRAREEELRAWVARMRNHLAREGIEDAAVRVRRRAEDRRAGDLARLPRRRARARRDARQRRGRRGRHPQPAHDPVDPAADRRRAAAARGPRRGLHVAAGLRRAQRAPRRGRAVDVHEPAQLRRRDDPPARPEARRRAPAVDVVLRRSASPRGSRFARHWEALEWLREHGFRVNGDVKQARRPRTRSSRSAWPGRSAAARSTSRSTASWSRSTTSSCSAASASSAATRAGRSPGSSRRRPR